MIDLCIISQTADARHNIDAFHIPQCCENPGGKSSPCRKRVSYFKTNNDKDNHTILCAQSFAVSLLFLKCTTLYSPIPIENFMMVDAGSCWHLNLFNNFMFTQPLLVCYQWCNCMF
jgi:hypothetical protein